MVLHQHLPAIPDPSLGEIALLVFCLALVSGSGNSRVVPLTRTPLSAGSPSDIPTLRVVLDVLPSWSPRRSTNSPLDHHHGKAFNDVDRHCALLLYLPRLCRYARRMHRCIPSFSFPPTGALSWPRRCENLQILDGIQMLRRASASLHQVATPEIRRRSSYWYVVFAALRIARSQPYVQARTSSPSATRRRFPPFLAHQAHAKARVRLRVSHLYAYA